MRCDVESLADFAQYYQDSWVKGVNHGTVVAVIKSPAGRILLKEYNNRGEELTTNIPAAVKDLSKYVRFGLPPIGMTRFTDTGELVYLSYDTIRRGDKGLATQRLITHTHNGWSLWKLGHRSFSSERDLDAVRAIQIIYPNYSTWREVVDGMLNPIVPTMISAALSKTTGVYINPGFENPLFVYKEKAVGEVLDEQVVIWQAFVDLIPLIKLQLGGTVNVKHR